MEIFGSYTGTDFLIFYGVMLATVMVASMFMPLILRSEGRYGELSDMEDIAVLAGGADRHTSVITSDLLARGGLREYDRKRLIVSGERIETGQSGAAVLRERGTFRLKAVTSILEWRTQEIESSLIRRGLMLDKGERWKLRLLVALPFVLLLLIGAYRWNAGDAAGEDTGFLFILIVATFILGIERMAKVTARTRAGEEALKRLRTKSERLQSAPTAPEVGVAVAIFGTAVLVGTPFEAVHAMRQSQGGDGADVGDDGGDGGGCGGGCGGCGD